MSGVITAVAVTGLVSAKMSSDAAGDAADAQRDATNSAASSAASELAFAKEQQDRWDEVFGPTQDVLSDYYNNLDPEDEANKQIIAGVQNIQKGYQDYDTQLQQTLSQRGMNDSGLGAELSGQAIYQNEMDKARLRTDVTNNAEANVANQQMNFLGLGMGIQPSLNAGVQSAYNSEQTVYNNQANYSANQEAQANASFANAIGGIGTGLGYFMQPGSSVPATTGPVAGTASYPQLNNMPVTW